jgi:hypothetical protein
LEPKDVPGSSSLDEAGRAQLEEMFGVRYHVIQSGDPLYGNRKERRANLREARRRMKGR